MDAANDEGMYARNYRWRIHRPVRPPLEVCISPERDESVVLAMHTDAAIIEPLLTDALAPTTAARA